MKHREIPTHSFQALAPLAFKIERLSHVNRYNPFRVHRHDYYEIFLFEEGGGEHLIDFESVPIEARQIHFVTPGQVHQVRRAPDSSGYVLLFTTEFCPPRYERDDFLAMLPRFGSPAIALDAGVFAECLAIVQHMMGIFSGNNSRKKSVLQAYLHIFLCHCWDNFEKQNRPEELGPVSGLRVFQQFQVEVENHFAQLHQVADYARLLALSPRTLNELCQRYAASSAIEYLHKRLSLEAKRLLSYSDAGIGEIGFSLGFEDPAHFSRFVKKCTGKPPSGWRAGT